MNPKGIKEGDLVIQIKGCPDCKCSSLGVPFRVTSISYEIAGYACPNHRRGGNTVPELNPSHGAHGFKQYIIPTAWLIKIEPEGELEVVENKKELTV
jgi:hypothetical protein